MSFFLLYPLERRLRSNERMVLVQRTGVLPREPSFGRIRHRRVSAPVPALLCEVALILQLIPSISISDPFSPFFDKLTLDLPGAARPFVITSTGAASKPYVKSLTLNGVSVEQPVLRHEDIMKGGELVFEMSAVPEAWGSATVGGLA